MQIAHAYRTTYQAEYQGLALVICLVYDGKILKAKGDC